MRVSGRLGYNRAFLLRSTLEADAGIVKTAGDDKQVFSAAATRERIGAGGGATGADQAQESAGAATGSFRLLRYFSIASLIAIVLAVAGLGFFFRETAVKQLIRVGEDSNVGLTTAFANTLRPDYVPLIEAAERSSTAQLKANPAIAAVDKAVRDAVRHTHVVKVKIFDLKGRTIYSSEPRQIGEDHSSRSGFLAAREGGVQTFLYERASFDAFGRTVTDRSLLASYVPVRRPGANKPDAVFELYSDVTPFLEEIRRTQRNLRIGTAIVMILLYGALFLIVKRADTVIKAQERQRRRDAETIRHLAHHDTLTGLPNRKLFTERLAATIGRARRGRRMAALMFIDLDRFKEINDTLGHSAGDRVLQAAGRLLRGSLRDVDTVARLGGDEFTIILEDVADASRVVTVAEKIKEAFAAPVTTENGLEIFVTPSIGITLYPADAENIEALVHAADAAMYEAKAAGRNTYRFYRAAPAA